MGYLWRFAICSLLSMQLIAGEAPMNKTYGQMSRQEINQLLKETSQKGLTNAQKIEFYSERFLGTPYDLACEGDGPYALYETMPLMNLEKTNCMCMVEIVLAMSLSTHYEEMFNVLQHIRYRHGLIGMATRNHYTIADWLPANRWCLEDVTPKVGGTYCKPLTRTISHREFFKSKGITDIEDMLPDRTLTIQYIPKEELLKVQDKLHSGDIVSVIMDKPGIFSAHMGLIIKKDNQTYFRHASQAAMTTLDQPFAEYVDTLMKNPKRLGMVFMRVKEKVEWKIKDNPQHGKIELKDIKE
jgi:hypothetical protein